MLDGGLGSDLSSALRSVRGALAGATEVQCTSAAPGNGVALSIGDGHDGIVESALDVSSTGADILALSLFSAGFCRSSFVSSHVSVPPYFFLLATVRLGPLQVRALVLVRWPRQGRPLRWRTPR